MHDHYYVLRENGEIVAGCQYHRVHWVVQKMKGVFAKGYVFGLDVGPQVYFSDEENMFGFSFRIGKAF